MTAALAEAATQRTADLSSTFHQSCQRYPSSNITCFQAWGMSQSLVIPLGFYAHMSITAGSFDRMG